MDFSTMFNTWLKVLTNPREETFQEELDSPRATLTNALIWMFLAGVVVALFSFLVSLTSLNSAAAMEEMLRENPDIPPEFAQMMTPMMPMMMGAGSVLSVILTPIVFLIGTGIYYLIAMLMGGKGDFGRYSYLLASFQAPLAIARTLVGFVPLLGVCISLAIFFYELFLSYLATKVAFNLSSGRALVVVLTPILLFILAMVCLFFFILSLALAANGSTAP
ncbi:MAG: YIP1 family protein [Ardenticatenales bacterium]|nr:YIP1 family protein [Ardenticatenales bacterium]